jgi:uncharacterized membrane protein
MPFETVTKPRALWLGALIFSVIVIADSWFRWATFQYTTFDIAFYAQALWLAGKGVSQVSLLDVPLMGNHQEPITFLLFPFYKVWSHPMLLVVIQTLALATMPFTGWRIARHLEFGARASMWLGLATLLAPATGFIALHEFHPEALAAPLLLLLLEARLKARPGLFWLWFLLTLACKENMGLLLAWMCAVNYVLDRERGRDWRIGWNVIPGVVALGWFLGCALWIGPKLNAGHVDYLELYSHLGASGGAIVTGFFTEPSRAAGALWRGFTGGNLIWGLLVPFLLLPILRPRWLVVAAPLFAQHLLSWRSSEWSINYHYAAPLVPLIWFGAVDAASRLFWRDTLAGWLVVACAVCQLWFGPAKRVWGTVAGASEALRARAWKREMLVAIPAEASVTAGLPYLSHLANRERLYSLHHILKGLKTLSRKEHKPPAPTDVVVVDTADLATFNAGKEGYFHPRMRTVTGQVIPASDTLLHEFLLQAEWRKLSRNEFTIYLQGKPAPSEAPNGEGRKLDEYHTLLAIQPMPPLPGDAMLFRMSWDLQPKRESLLWTSLYLRDESGRLFSIGKGPIGLDTESGRITEAWAVRLPPDLKPGKYRGLMLVYDPFESTAPADKQRFKRVTFDVGEFQL